MAIRLYDLAGAEDDRRFSPYCWRAKMALKHKGLEFETIPWRFTDKAAIAASGSSTVPVLVDGGQTIADSWRIALYLDEAYPSRPAQMFGDVWDWAGDLRSTEILPIGSAPEQIAIKLLELEHDVEYWRESASMPPARMSTRPSISCPTASPLKNYL